ncbi:hypothetical protein [Vallitalea guaymasensis]|uniref:hypothetical protein n=1 Tax=Vallitalea guaymasensis TaxID=1185412 RepID=UPI00272C7216|nr:hypothetical protein [Vallitalea guaymasensis]
MKKKILNLMLVLGILSLSVMPIKASGTYWEQENNDSKSSANVFSIDKSPMHILGYVSEQDEEDNFILEADYSGKMQIDFMCYASSDGDFDFYIRDSKGKLLEKYANISGNKWEYIEIDIEKGDYLHVYIDHDAGYLTKPYDIEVDID